MKRYLVVVLLVVNMVGYACDNCNVYLGINPNDFYHNIGLRLRTRFHQGTFNNVGVLMQKHGGAEPIITNSTIRETYQRLELTGKYFWNPKWNTQIIVPYVRNTQEVNEAVNYFVQGIGDITLMQNYLLFNTKDYSDSIVFKHRLSLGLGLKLATGRIDVERPLGVPNLDLQPGTGSWDGIVSGTYTAMLKKFGLMMNANYKINSDNKDGFRYGNSLNVFGNLFSLLKIGKQMQLMPSSGVYIESFAQDVMQQSLIMDSGGRLVMMDVGLGLYYGKFKTQFNYQKSLTNRLNNEQQLPTMWRYNVGVSINF